MELETKRQLFHMITGFITLILIYIGIFDAKIIFLIIILGGVLSLLSAKIDIPVVRWFLDNMERKEYRHTFPGRGPIFMFVGILLALKLFDRRIALASIAVLAFGDSISHLVGRYYAKKNGRSTRRKLIEGTLSGALAGFAAALFFISPFEAMAASFGAMFIEGIEIEMNKKAVDDNLYIPLVAGTIVLISRSIGL